MNAVTKAARTLARQWRIEVLRSGEESGEALLKGFEFLLENYLERYSHMDVDEITIELLEEK